MQKLRTVLTVFLSVFSLLTGCSQEDSIEFTARINTKMTSIDNQTSREISELSIAVSEDLSKADITLTVDNHQIKCQCECVLFDYEETGIYGILDGEISFEKQTMPITVDMYYISSKENFSAVTIGAIGDAQFGTWFFGKQTENINTLSAKYIESKN